MVYYYEKYDATDFQFQDLTAIIKKKWIVAFCQELISRNLNISWQIPVGTRSEAIDKEVADLLIKSGCNYIQYAPESGWQVVGRIRDTASGFTLDRPGIEGNFR